MRPRSGIGLALPVAVLLLPLGACAPANGSSGLTCGGFPGTQVQLYGATAFAADDVWAVGSYQHEGPGIPLTEHWNGQRWTAIEAPTGPWVGSARLNAVAGAGPADIWAVGAGQARTGYEQTLIEHWDGQSWSIVASPNASSSTNSLAALDVVGPNDVWAVGTYFDGGRDLVLAEHWDGHSWSIVPGENPAAALNWFSGVAGATSGDVWAFGLRRESDSATPQTLLEHWDGQRWQVVPTPSPGRNPSLVSIAATSPTDVWAVGAYDTGKSSAPLTEHWNGADWTMQAAPRNLRGGFTSASAGPGAVLYIAAESGQAQANSWQVERLGGGRWTSMGSFQASYGTLSAVVAADASPWAIGWYRKTACGPDWGLVKRWQAGSWAYVPSPHDGMSGGT